MSAWGLLRQAISTPGHGGSFRLGRETIHKSSLDPAWRFRFCGNRDRGHVLPKNVRWKQSGSQKSPDEVEFCFGQKGRSRDWTAIRDTLMGSLRWSGPSKWVERHSRRALEVRPMQLLELEGHGTEIIGSRSYNSGSPVWQRPILMGEKCELPWFSGLVLYDEQGRPLHDSYKGTTHQQQDYFLVRQRRKESITGFPKVITNCTRNVNMKEVFSHNTEGGIVIQHPAGQSWKQNSLEIFGL